MREFNIRFFHYSSNSILISWPDLISIEISNDIDSLIKHLKVDKNILELIKGYNSLLVQYKNDISDFNLSCNFLKKIYNELDRVELEKKLIWEIPVCYEMNFAKDINFYSKKISLSHEQIINLHSSKTYFLHMYGFLPGFMYLGGLDKKLAISRKTIPDRKILKGSVAVGGNQTGIYPSQSPGGWYVIGNSPINLFKLIDDNSPVEIPVGSYVKFISVSSTEYYDIKDEVDNNKYQLVKKKYND